MSSERLLRRKLTLRAHGEQIVFVKKKRERIEHVLMKAFLWALYLPDYPQLSIEIPIGDKYKPDVVQMDAFGVPTFWGEAGKVSVAKIESLTRRYRNTHFAIGKWAMNLDPYTAIVRESLAAKQRNAPFDLIRFPADSSSQFIDERGTIHLTHAEVDWVRLF